MHVPPDPALGQGEELRLSQDGRWFHDGDPIRHARLCALLDRSVAHDEQGRLIVTTGRDRLPLVSDDAPLRIKTARAGDGPLIQVVRDGREEPLTSTSALCIDEDGRVRSRVTGPRGGLLWALWERPAVQALMPLLEEDDEGPHLDVDGRKLTLRVVDSPQDWTM